MFKNLLKIVKNFSGFEKANVSHAERLVSAAGGIISIACIYFTSQFFIGTTGIEMLVASMGASAVLLFAVPHGQMSQPWAVMGGHTISALIGISCALLIQHDTLAAALAVGLAIGAMYYLNCVHPPGGATALSAVLGGEAVQSLGYQFVITPVLTNVIIILAVAIAFNYFFHWRRYPFHLHKKFQQKDYKLNRSTEISHADFVYALSQVDSFIDVSEYDLLRIYEMATDKSHQRRNSLDNIVTGNFYSNGEYGANWSVREVVDQSLDKEDAADALKYKTVAGKGRRTTGALSRADFMDWAKYQVERDEDNWKRINDKDTSE